MVSHSSCLPLPLLTGCCFDKQLWSTHYRQTMFETTMRFRVQVATYWYLTSTLDPGGSWNVQRSRPIEPTMLS